MNLGLQNKNALVCGSTQGIGKATAILLAEEGVNVTLIARNEEKLKEVLAELPNKNQKHNYLVADFSNPEELQKVIENTELKFHILVNNTGGPKSGDLISATSSDLINAFQMHVICNQILVQAFVPFMKKEKFGRIINVISTSVKEPIPGLGVSNTIRNAVGNWAKTLSTELAAFQITVNNVLPGFTDTARLDQIIKIKSKLEHTTEAEMEQIMKNYVPAKRFAKPEETAAAVVFLASEQASYINGINLPVDGGRTKSL
ncbi:SDR family oxidoreductase [Polaribacter undariae]|uniref:SDR family oxidoreductase n=1 Tax=Polaribacter sejongensis TaxID=985043 RepID=A0AAJ1QVX1_9FLAO|nr:SDR family oxidoreductase [Polaribacter undariae]MDN3619268.1 SDR family oxidoreductase [Polaribacter undariae]UWD33532.1 SDR family oxidoreductase [Polaribacter undariae]